jgi:adenosine kinase
VFLYLIPINLLLFLGFFFLIGETVKEFPVPVIEEDKILDTNGAGDSFVGGFLSQLVQGKDLDKCVDCGIWVSELVIQQSGMNF